MSETKINKSIPMDQSMIDEIHELILMHMKATGKLISFGEAARIMLKGGIEEIKANAKTQKHPKSRDLRLLTGYRVK